MAKRIVAVVGTYRKGHIIDSSVDAVLDFAKQSGAEVEKIELGGISMQADQKITEKHKGKLEKAAGFLVN